MPRKRTFRDYLVEHRDSTYLLSSTGERARAGAFLEDLQSTRSEFVLDAQTAIAVKRIEYVYLIINGQRMAVPFMERDTWERPPPSLTFSETIVTEPAEETEEQEKVS